MELVGVIERSVLTNGVVDFALSMDGFLNHLVEEARLLVGLFGANGVGFAVQVALNNDVLSGGVSGEGGCLSFLDVDSPGGEISLDLDRLDDSLHDLHVHRGGQVGLELGGDFSHTTLLDRGLCPTLFQLLVDFKDLKVFELNIDEIATHGGANQVVRELESSVFVVDFRDASKGTGVDSVCVGLASFPGIISRYNASQKANAY